MNWLMIALGGALGALARAGVGHWLASSGARWPLAALSVNVLGCFLAGALLVLLLERNAADSLWRAFLMVGFLGAFTTFSAFSVETLQLYESAGVRAAVAHMLLNVVGSVLACVLGVWLSRSYLLSAG